MKIYNWNNECWNNSDKKWDKIHNGTEFDKNEPEKLPSILDGARIKFINIDSDSFFAEYYLNNVSKLTVF